MKENYERVIPITFLGRGLVKISGKNYWILEAPHADHGNYTLTTIFLTDGKAACLQLPKDVSKSDIEIINHFLDFLLLKISIDKEESDRILHSEHKPEESDNYERNTAS